MTPFFTTQDLDLHHRPARLRRRAAEHRLALETDSRSALHPGGLRRRADER